MAHPPLLRTKKRSTHETSFQHFFFDYGYRVSSTTWYFPLLFIMLRNFQILNRNLGFLLYCFCFGFLHAAGWSFSLRQLEEGDLYRTTVSLCWFMCRSATRGNVKSTRDAPNPDQDFALILVFRRGNVICDSYCTATLYQLFRIITIYERPINLIALSPWCDWLKLIYFNHYFNFLYLLLIN